MPQIAESFQLLGIGVYVFVIVVTLLSIIKGIRE